MKIKNKITRLGKLIKNENGSLQSFATTAGFTFIAVTLIMVAYGALSVFFPDFLDNMLNAIEANFTI